MGTFSEAIRPVAARRRIGCLRKPRCVGLIAMRREVGGAFGCKFDASRFPTDYHMLPRRRRGTVGRLSRFRHNVIHNSRCLLNTERKDP